jgi:DNA-binding transcriptional regulator YiaG
MNLQVFDGNRYTISPFGTSGYGDLPLSKDWEIFRIGGTLAIRGTSSSEALCVRMKGSAAEQTNSGLAAIDTTMTTSSAIAELRRRSGLTWDQLARLFGVARRSIHFWASGKALNAANEERLSRMLAVVRYVDCGTAQSTRAALITAQNDGMIPLDLLAKDRFDEVKARLGGGPQRSMPALIPLSTTAWEARMPPPPDERIGALHASVHREIGKSRVARTVKVKSKR